MRQCTHKLGASKKLGASFLEKNTCSNVPNNNLGAMFLLEERRLRQRTHKLGASKNLGGRFSGEKKGPCGNVPTS